jgi:hypothetical protein
MPKEWAVAKLNGIFTKKKTQGISKNGTPMLVTSLLRDNCSIDARS